MRKLNEELLNELAVGYVGGNEQAGEEFFNQFLPALKAYANKRSSGLPLDAEDLFGEFQLVAMKAIQKYDISKGKNVSGLIYEMCKTRAIDLYRETQTAKRVDVIEHNGEFMRRTMSIFQEDSENFAFIDKVSNGDKPLDQQVIQTMESQEIQMVVRSFVSQAKGRNKQIVPLIYTAQVLDWEEDELQGRIGNVIEEMTGSYPSNAVIRKAKQRALEALKTYFQVGEEYFMAEKLGL